MIEAEAVMDMHRSTKPEHDPARRQLPFGHILR